MISRKRLRVALARRWGVRVRDVKLSVGAAPWRVRVVQTFVLPGFVETIRGYVSA